MTTTTDTAADQPAAIRYWTDRLYDEAAAVLAEKLRDGTYADGDEEKLVDAVLQDVTPEWTESLAEELLFGDMCTFAAGSVLDEADAGTFAAAHDAALVLLAEIKRQNNLPDALRSLAISRVCEEAHLADRLRYLDHSLA